MAKNDNFVILEEESHHEDEEFIQNKDIKKPDLKNKTLLYVVIGLLITTIVVLTLLVMLFLNKKEKEKEAVNTKKIIKTIKEKTSHEPKKTKIEQQLLQASTLFDSGKKEEALKIYEQISLKNKALSFYNIGVAKMKDKNYLEAIKSFQSAISYNSYKCASAINIAVSASIIRDTKLFYKYVNLASKYLPLEIDSPLYTYYMSLISYYKELYPESLISLKHQSSNFYQDKQKLLSAKIATLLENDHLAINFLQNSSSLTNFLALGLLYAKIGEYTISAKYLQKSLNEGYFPLKSKVALSLVYLKSGLLAQSANMLKETHEQYKEKAQSIYPIQVHLKESLFDPVVAQKEFKNTLFFSDKRKFSLIFYFAPFKIANFKHSISYIDKGAKNVFINETKAALEFLNKSKNISEVNLIIAKGIKATYEDKLYIAKKIFHSALKKYPSHSILHFNLALVYAKTDDFKNAHKHFLKSYRLDSKNYQAMIFGYMSAKILNIDESELLNQSNEKLLKESNLKEKNLLLAIANIATNQSAMLNLKDTPNTPLKIVLEIIKTQNNNDKSLYKSSAKSLHDILPKDLISNIIYLDSQYGDKDIKKYAKAIQEKLTKKNLNFQPLFYGSALSKKMYIESLNIAGIVNFAKKMLKQKLENENEDSVGLIQSLAYANIYTKNFESSYVLYNELIDAHKQRDSNTIFFAATASIGAKHHENAIALLELSKLIDPSNNESRHALGLLYHEAKNLEGASIQYNKIGDINFQSNYFTFDIDLDSN